MISDEILSVIMDIGSFYVRCGFSGEDAPRHHSTSKVGLLPEQNTTAMEQEKTKRIYGDESLTRPLKNLEITDVIKNGVIDDYDNYEHLLKYCYSRLNVLLVINLQGRTERVLAAHCQ
jgi:actin-related protein